MAQPHPHIQATTLRSLQRVDPGITKTLAQAGYVVAYREVGEGGWEKMGVEGGLFVYESKSTPPNGLIILNRNGIKNWQKPLVPRRTSITVQGSWLYIHGLDMDAFRSPATTTGARQGEGGDGTPTRKRGRKVEGNPGEGRKTRVALYCHSVNNVAGNEEASRLAEFLTTLCGPCEDEPAPPAEPTTGNPPLTETTSLPVLPTQRPENPVSPAPGQAQTAGMSMAALLEKLQAPNTASPARELPHSSSFPSTHPSNGVASPHVKPAQAAGQGQDLTMALKQMMGLKVTNTPTQPTNGHPNLQTPTRTPAHTVDSRHVATPPQQQQQIHLAPALGTPGMQSPHVRPALGSQQGSQQSFDMRARYIPYPPQGFPQHTQHPGLPTYPSNQSQQHPGYPHLNTMSPRPSFQGHVQQQNGDVFAARGHPLNQGGAAQAVVNAWNRAPQNGMPEQGNPEQKREFVNALLGAIHTDAAFVDRLWQEYCAAQRGYVPPG